MRTQECAPKICKLLLQYARHRQTLRNGNDFLEGLNYFSFAILGHIQQDEINVVSFDARRVIFTTGPSIPSQCGGMLVSP